MLGKNTTDRLLAKIREGQALSTKEKLNLIVELSIPSILAQITSVLMFYIDASMVGHLGAEASASIGLVESTTWLFSSITNAISLGFSVQAAHFIGANDFMRARQVFRHGLVISLTLSVLIMLVGVAIAFPLPYWLGGGEDIVHNSSLYFLIFMLAMPAYQLNNLCGAMLKSSGNMRVPSVVSVMMCGLDIVFNYLFIFVLGFGVPGAAMGTALAILTAGCTQAYFAIVRNKILRLRQDRIPFSWVWGYLRNALKISSPMALQSTLMSGAQIMSTIIVAPLGNFAIAANSFAVTAESLCYMPGYGIGDAATTLVGQSMGAGRKDLCRSLAYMTVGLGITSLRIEAFAEPFFGAAIITYCVCVGAGDTIRPMLINLGSMWLMRLTLAALLAPHYGLPGVWFAMAVELTFRGCLFLWQLFRGKWMERGLRIVKTP